MDWSHQKQDDVTHPLSNPPSKDQRVHCITQSRWSDFRHTTISGNLFLNNLVKLPWFLFLFEQYFCTRIADKLISVTFLIEAKKEYLITQQRDQIYTCLYSPKSFERSAFA